MHYLGHIDLPASALDPVSVSDLAHLGVGSLPWHHAAARLVHEVAARVLGPGRQIRAEGTIGGEQLVRHVRRGCRAVHPQFWDLADALVPARQHQVGEVNTVVVVQVGQKQVVD